MGLMGSRTPNIDRSAAEGATFTDSYGQQSCTAGRASFILGQEPFRTGLLTSGMPGDPHGIPEWMPTIADVLKTQGNIWLLVPIQGKIKDFFADFDQFPLQTGSSLNAGDINYGMLRQQAALNRLEELETLTPQ